MKRKVKKMLPWILTAMGLMVFAYGFYQVFGPNTGEIDEAEYLYVKTGSDYETVKNTLISEEFIDDAQTFGFVAKLVDYPSHVKPGRYRIKAGMSNYKIVTLLRKGKQNAVRLVVNKFRTKTDFIRFVAANLEPDTNKLKQLMNDDSYLAQFGMNSTTAMCAIMPDTYEFWWNTTPENIYSKIAQNYIHFWDGERKVKANLLGLTPQKVMILASIVDEETNYEAEKPYIASVYLNRLAKGMKLQADPTVKFAVGDFTIKRITGIHTAAVSPYNTYMYAGLPPGPICTPSKSSIDAVLNASKTDYLYFCAKEDMKGTHRFAATYDEHLRNAASYQKKLDTIGVR